MVSNPGTFIMCTFPKNSKHILKKKSIKYCKNLKKKGENRENI